MNNIFNNKFAYRQGYNNSISANMYVHVPYKCKINYNNNNNNNNNMNNNNLSGSSSSSSSSLCDSFTMVFAQNHTVKPLVD